MSTSQTAPCVITVDQADLPHRSAAVVVRDLAAVSMHAHHLADSSPRGPQKGPPFTASQLIEALEASSPKARDAAFLAGRCRAPDPSDDQALVEALRGAMRTNDSARTKAEAAMSLVLRGEDREESHRVLLQAASGPLGEHPWIAAGYAAQLGDGSGWPTLERALAPDAILATRASAARILVDFVPLNGEKVGTTKIDPFGAMARLTEDGDPGMRQAIVGILVEAAHPDARSLLTRLETDDHDSVSLLARNALQRLR